MQGLCAIHFVVLLLLKFLKVGEDQVKSISIYAPTVYRPRETAAFATHERASVRMCAYTYFKMPTHESVSHHVAIKSVLRETATKDTREINI